MEFPQFEKTIKKHNFRPLLLSQQQIFDILADRRFSKIGFYVVSLKSPNIDKKITTLRYILFDKDENPYNFDGTRSSSKKNSYYLKKWGLAVNNEGQTSFTFSKDEVHEIFVTSDTTLKKRNADIFSYVVFMVFDESIVDLVSTTKRITLHYEVVDKWKEGGGGPAAGSRGPAPVSDGNAEEG